MRRALDLAAESIALVSPNPLVGCVIVSSNGDVVGEGSYSYANVTHAEMLALAQAGEQARGGTAYVSLEPHDHHGKTPPCTAALIQAGIGRVVAPIEDPNPLVSGKGFQTLRDAAIEV
ncbi:MAG TPA: bifunctional diaminohydroxyphosphoribosylaminopyrimidine deaminase/5-amino-6-(5-phosphoribosylamino)uracil reductase RibD, partial [Pyrinomonadaceae bacterium]|nr:bifunctional diaminohydroxyphosphoribosylaminopyrimidine deaminase/5-amino-6-(5-phosphoribosylamino)uracil reductase RibD [Pyrinomonadaceae bacterium]